MELAVTSCVVAFLLLLPILIHNGIVKRRRAVDQAWSEVIATQHQFEEVIPSLEALLENYATYESDVSVSVVKLQESLLDLNNLSVGDATGSVMRQAQDLMRALHLSAEAYANLKTNEAIQKVMAEIARIQYRVNTAVKGFNTCVAHHNAGLKIFPNNVVNMLVNQQEPIEPFRDGLPSNRYNYSLA